MNNDVLRIRHEVRFSGSESHPKNNILGSIICDGVAILLFAIIGTTEHAITGGWPHKFLVALPYLISCVIAYLVLGLFRIGSRLGKGFVDGNYRLKNFLLKSVFICFATMLWGMFLRYTVFHQATPVLFICVGGSFLIIFMFSWRLVYFFWHWRRAIRWRKAI